MQPTTPPRRFALLALLLAPALAACAWQVPADPGLNHRRFARVETAEVATAVAAPGADQPVPQAAHDAGARTLYLNHCGRCHEPFEPSAVPAAEWPFYVQKYGPRAALFGSNRARVLAWLQANSR